MLKRNIIIMIAIACISLLTLSAKAKSRETFFRGGLMLGINGSQVDGDTYNGYNKVNGIAGVFVDREIFPSLFAAFEIKYIGKGAFEKYDLTDTYPNQYKVSFHYVEFPFLLRYQFMPALSAEAGLAAAYLFSAREEGTDGNGQIVTFNNREAFKEIETSFMFGANYHFNTRWMMNFRFSYSLAPVAKNVQGNPLHYRGGGFNNNLLGFGVYYFLR